MLGRFTESSLESYSRLVTELQHTSFSEGRQESYDFTRCVRPDGSSYGTGGQCRKGTESSARVPVHQRDKVGGGPTPLERAADKLKQFQRRLENPDYSPSEKELEQFGKLKNALDSMKNAAEREKQDREVRPVMRTPYDLRRKAEKALDRARNPRMAENERNKAKEDLRIAIEDMEDQVESRVRGGGIFGSVGGLFKGDFDRHLDRANKANTEEMAKEAKRLRKIYESL